MASLWAQKRMVKALSVYYKYADYSAPGSFERRKEEVIKNEVPHGEFAVYFSTKMTWGDTFLRIFRNSYYWGTGYQFYRLQRNRALFTACMTDKFIEPGIDKDGKKYIRIGEGGEDLLLIGGYWEEVFKKYPTGKLISQTATTGQSSY